MKQYLQSKFTGSLSGKFSLLVFIVIMLNLVLNLLTDNFNLQDFVVIMIFFGQFVLLNYLRRLKVSYLGLFLILFSVFVGAFFIAEAFLFGKCTTNELSFYASMGGFVALMQVFTIAITQKIQK